MRLAYKIFPVQKPHPAFPKETSIWMPMLPIRLSYGHGKQSQRIDALIDSGAADCLFTADIAGHIGIKDITSGPKGEMGGVAAGVKIPVYYHKVHLWVGIGSIQVVAGFSPQLSVGALLGRRGFFENFIVTFDPCNTPPEFQIERIGHA